MYVYQQHCLSVYLSIISVIPPLPVCKDKYKNFLPDKCKVEYSAYILQRYFGAKNIPMEGAGSHQWKLRIG